jgi:hypothetical protein
MTEHPSIFKSQSKAKEYVKTQLNNILCYSSCVKIYPDTKEYDFMLWLINRHPTNKHNNQKIRKFIINRLYGHPQTFFQLDKEHIVFSWNACAINKKQFSPEVFFKRILRNTIEDQIITFYRTTKKVCKSKDHNSTKQYTKYEVDHKNEFSLLVKEFLEYYPIELKEIKYTNSTDITKKPIFDETDEYTKKLVDEWREYHELFADLQLLCYLCHKNKTKQFMTKKNI